jgi:hypothetical protein
MAANVRIEIYNVLNHANLYVMDDSTDVSPSTQTLAVRGCTGPSGYGRPGDGQRRIQLGLKFVF